MIQEKKRSLVCEEIRQVYTNYPHPWVIGYSGGKDSTATVQLVWQALESLPIEELNKPIYVISTDTLVETPLVVDYVEETITLMKEAAKASKLPFHIHRLKPVLDDTFWVNLIGRGYPAPNNIFRWCTERLKIRPSNRFILEKVAESGEVILALGMRRGESAKRTHVVKEHHYDWHLLSRHGQIPGAWIYTPIEYFTTEDVWTYLLQNSSPWGSSNHQLRALYKSAQDGECPMVVDTTTPPCGNSRFGCWVCTVVDRDRAMEALIDDGEEWLIPLLEFRDWLAETQDPNVKPMQREYKGRNGQIRINDGGQLLWRTYTLDFSREMLKRLLQTQTEIQGYAPQFSLVSLAELREIRRLWITERQDWEDSLPRIYREVIGRSEQWDANDIGTPGTLELELLQRITEQHDMPLRLPQKLLDAEWQFYGMRRRGLIHKTIESILREDWRSLEEVQQEAAQRKAEAILNVESL